MFHNMHGLVCHVFVERGCCWCRNQFSQEEEAKKSKAVWAGGIAATWWSRRGLVEFNVHVVALTCCFIISVLACYLQFLEMFAWLLIIFEWHAKSKWEENLLLKELPDIFWKSRKNKINFNFSMYVLKRIKNMFNRI